MKQNVSETGSNWRFRKNVKTCLQNKKSYPMPLSRHGHFHPILITHPHSTGNYYTSTTISSNSTSILSQTTFATTTTTSAFISNFTAMIFHRRPLSKNKSKLKMSSPRDSRWHSIYFLPPTSDSTPQAIRPHSVSSRPALYQVSPPNLKPPLPPPHNTHPSRRYHLSKSHPWTIHLHHRQGMLFSKHHQAFIQALLSTAVFPQRFGFFTVCLVQWLRKVASW